MSSYLILIHEDGTPEKLFSFPTPSAREAGVSTLRAFLDDEVKGLANPRNSREVFVTMLDEEKYEQWRRERREQTGRLPGELVSGQRFPSAAAASRHLGYTRGYNRVAMLLREVEDGTEYFAEEGGATWLYCDQTKD